jgi:hypothetical protein
MEKKPYLVRKLLKKYRLLDSNNIGNALHSRQYMSTSKAESLATLL